MRCPRCSELNPAGAAICQNCDEILDASFLDGVEAPAEVPGDKTDVGPAPTTRDLRPARLRASRTRGSWNPAVVAPPAAALAPEPPKGTFLAEPEAAQPTPVKEARRAATDLRDFYLSLAAADKWASAMSTALLVALLFPWRWTREDEEIMGYVAAWPVALLAAAVVALIYLRARHADARMDGNLRVAQNACAALTAVFTGAFLPWSTEARALHGGGHSLELMLSKPLFGAYLGLGCAILALAASLPALFSRE